MKKTLILAALALTCGLAVADGNKGQPTNCREWIAAKFGNKAIRDAMTVGLGSKGTPGVFVGKVTEVDGTLLMLLNSTTKDNAVIQTEGAKLYDIDRLNLGALVVGYGVQIGSTPGKRANGAATTIAAVEAQCVSPVPIAELFGTMMR